MLKGDISFAYDVFNTFLQRVDERVKFVDELLAMPHDFTVDEEMITDPDAADLRQERGRSPGHLARSGSSTTCWC